MATYNTTSGFSDLVGSMVVTNNNVDSYTSNTQGAGTVQNLGGTGLNFNVRFASVNRTYNITATANGSNGYSGNANNNGPMEAEETWSATASTATDTADESREDVAYDSGEDTATKKAAQ